MALNAQEPRIFHWGSCQAARLGWTTGGLLAKQLCKGGAPLWALLVPFLIS